MCIRDRVEAAIKAITADGTTVLEEALMLPAPTDRDAAERELNQLVRQINNLNDILLLNILCFIINSRIV